MSASALRFPHFHGDAVLQRANPNITLSCRDDASPIASPPLVDVFVGGLSADVTEAQVRAAFEEAGQVHSVSLITYKRDSKCKGYGFVRFLDEAAALWSCESITAVRVTPGHTLALHFARTD